jgi:hypothetical protein
MLALRLPAADFSFISVLGVREPGYRILEKAGCPVDMQECRVTLSQHLP